MFQDGSWKVLRSVDIAMKIVMVFTAYILAYQSVFRKDRPYMIGAIFALVVEAIIWGAGYLILSNHIRDYY